MSGPQFTPGPWSAVPNGEIDGSIFCSLAEGLSVFADNEVDIALVAAAPDLYEALNSLLPIVRRALRSGIDDPSVPGSITGPLGFAYEDAFVALDKVRGEQ